MLPFKDLVLASSSGTVTICSSCGCYITLKLAVLRRLRKELQELRVFPSGPSAPGPHVSLTEQGLVDVSVGCPKLQSVLYFCHQMTNNALLTIARKCPNMIQFRLCIIKPQTPVT